MEKIFDTQFLIELNILGSSENPFSKILGKDVFQLLPGRNLQNYMVLRIKKKAPINILGR